jgi:HlyD family secretion protein
LRGDRVRQAITRNRIIAGVVVVVLILGGYLLATQVVFRPAQQAPITAKVQRGTLVASVGASGALQANNDVVLTFQSGGTVAEILVTEGDKVTKGTPLARLDRTDLQLQVQQAEANLASAQARLDQVKAGATEKDLQVAQAQLKSAQAKYQQTVQTRPQDVASAQAQLEQAQAKLDALLKGPTPEDIASAQAKVQQAQENLERTKSSASAAKEQARLAMEQAADSLRDAQNKWNTAYWDYVHASTDETDPVTGKPLNDRQIQQYKDAKDAAWLAVQQAEAALEKAKVAYQDAQNQEIAQVQAAQAQLDDAKAQLQKLLNGPSDEDIRQARAAVEQAQANLLRLQNSTPGDLVQLQAAVDQASATLKDLEAGPKAWDLAAAMAAVEQAKAQLDLAKLRYDQAELKAPFDGVVQAVNIKVGQTVGASTPAIELVDTSRMYVDANVSEVDVANIRSGQEVEITFDALPGRTFTGKVAFVAPKGEVQQGVVQFKVRVELTGETRGPQPGTGFSRGGRPGAAQTQTPTSGQAAQQATPQPTQSPAPEATPGPSMQRPEGSPTPATNPMPGMTASLSIITARADNVLLVPNRAIVSQGGRKVVNVMVNGRPTPVEVQTGRSSGTMTEVISGLKEGDEVVVELSPTNVVNPLNRPPTGGGFR